MVRKRQEEFRTDSIISYECCCAYIVGSTVEHFKAHTYNYALVFCFVPG